MVTRIVGNIEGQEILFLPFQDNLWKAQVPSVPSGKYVISLYAYDSAGNSSYFATILFTVDVDKLVYHIKFVDYTHTAKMMFTCGEQKISGFQLNPGIREYYFEVVEEGEEI